ncbi:hypothetical protein [Argonema antarcticum]|uniref:hypothetical protein n=1 Tax=Argonema antarcticum TaxID=2942763 RepID=UPI0020138EE7|nr:hypothetical protein [Argonema antarcticum]MCL1470395.1 hypothetical protein [Argonema antarcticum A004/B2]
MAKKENRHAATDLEQCKRMAKRNRWKLIRVEPTGLPILKVDCIFEGEQTSFMEDDRNE